MVTRELLTLTIISLIKFVLSGSRSSIIFVIDDTGSMSDDIDQVKHATNRIFDAVLNAGESAIDNFILVTFNDPDNLDGPVQLGATWPECCVKLRTVTANRTIFKQELASIFVGGGGYCPEYSMGGIKYAIEQGLPRSYVYVFTDASAKDYKNYEKVKYIAKKYQAQVDFVLTGDCHFHIDEYLVYEKLAEDTSGIVFHMDKKEVGEFIVHVTETIKTRPTLLASKEFGPGHHKFNYTSDPLIKNETITITGHKPSNLDINVTNSDGTKSKTDVVFDSKRIKIIKIQDSYPGNRTVAVSSNTDTKVKVTAESTIKFSHGFSTFKPSKITETTFNPIPDEPSYISIILTNGDIELRTVTLLDMDGNDIKVIPLNKLKVKEKLYITEKENIPHQMFRIAINGYDTVSKTNIRRINSSPVDPRKPAELVIIENKAPELKIEGSPVIEGKYKNPMTLTCTVTGNPKPDIIWRNVDEDIVLSSEVYVKEVSYEYLSILNIINEKNYTTYRCEASNALGNKATDITVKLLSEPFIEILEKPKDIKIEYGKNGQVFCKVRFYPTAEVNWYKNGKLIFSNDKYKMTADKSVLTINNMQLDDVGKYTCEVRNAFGRKILMSKVSISGVELPKIKATNKEIFIKEDLDAVFNCKILKGLPKPEISWYYEGESSTETIEIVEWKNLETVVKKNVRTIDNGLYKCIAKNIVGQDNIEVTLKVEYPPSIKPNLKDKKIREGYDVNLPCYTDGNPRPHVTWFRNGYPLTVSERVHIYRDHRLKISKASFDDSGNYTCRATNKYNTISKTVNLEIYRPVKLKVPSKTQMQVAVGSNLNLECEATGYPVPEIKWIYKKFNSSTSNEIKFKGSLLPLKHIQIQQEGYYICEAEQTRGDKVSLTYEVHVYAKPTIENKYIEKVFRPVDGDLVLTINCTASGNPKPTINWFLDGLYIAIGETYDIKDGTLYIKNVTDSVTGTYICEATNTFGYDLEYYEVNVQSYPPLSSPTSTLYVTEGESFKINCPIPHKSTDYLRWYKDRRLIHKGELILKKAETSDAGHYTCRVSNFEKSVSGNVELKVGYKPRFITDEEENIEFIPELLVPLVCVAEAEPTPKISWYLNGNPLNYTLMEYYLEMSFGNQGVYKCVVENEFGSIERQFKVTLKDCVIDWNTKLSKNQPLMVSRALEWPNFETIDGKMLIPTSEYVTLFCPDQFKRFKNKFVTAFCDSESNFKINGEIINYYDIKCEGTHKHSVITTDEKCMGDKTRKIRIGYEILTKFIDVYEICFDIENNIAIYAKQIMISSLADVDIESNWSDEKYYNFNEMYNEDYQINVLSSQLGRWFHNKDKCLFKKRQLVSPKDVFPGVPQSATYSYLNVVPHWGTCSNENWNDVEQRVRDLTKSTYDHLIVWTGTSGELEMKDFYNKSMNKIYLIDETGNRQIIPKYIWKVVQDSASKSSLVVIQPNIPDLIASEIPNYTLCTDICHRTKWMKGSTWRDTVKGYTYCCSLNDFEKAFNFKERTFLPYYKVLYYTSFWSDHSLI